MVFALCRCCRHIVRQLTRPHFARSGCSQHLSHFCRIRKKLESETPICLLSMRCFASKQESYFSAIGGESDEPPPDLSPQQVTSILRRNEKTIFKSIKEVKLIECNQLASNHPVEDRVRISRLHFNSNKIEKNNVSETLILSVFDGHGGGACADIIVRRLFHYIALSLSPDPIGVVNKKIESTVEDLFVCPKVNSDSAYVYDSRSLEKIKTAISAAENECLSKYASDLKTNPSSDPVDAIRRAFKRCDDDLSREVEYNLSSKTSSNVILHYYLSVAASGCCVTLMLIHKGKCYVASSGDCRAVMGYEVTTSSSEREAKHVALSDDHNSDNIKEIKRLHASHPPNEQNNIIRNNRLLGHLMPLRAFGDFCYKWPVDRIKSVGLTRAFGPHIIPPHYYTPPYLIAEPEITMFSPSEACKGASKKFVVLATDGLWEQFESDRSLVECVIKQQTKTSPTDTGVESEASSYVFAEGMSLEHINRHLKVKAKPQQTNFRDSTNIDGDEEYDLNCCTYLIRSALGSIPSTDSHVDEQELQRQKHRRLVTFLTLPESVVRNFRDDISIILTHFN